VGHHSVCTANATREQRQEVDLLWGATAKQPPTLRRIEGVRVAWNARWHRRPPPLVSIRSHRWDGADLIRAHGQSSLYRTSSSDGAWRSSSPLTLRPDGVQENEAGRGRGRQGGETDGKEYDGAAVQQRQSSTKIQKRGQRRQNTRNTRFTSRPRADARGPHPNAIDPP